MPYSRCWGVIWSMYLDVFWKLVTFIPNTATFPLQASPVNRIIYVHSPHFVHLQCKQLLIDTNITIVKHNILK